MSWPFSGVLIGCGFFEQNHLHAWAEIDRIKIVVAVLNGTETPQPSGEDNLRTPAVALSAYEAIETRSVIDLGTWQEGRA